MKEINYTTISKWITGVPRSYCPLHTGQFVRLFATVTLYFILLSHTDAVVLEQDLNFTEYDSRVDVCTYPEIADNNTCTCSPGFTRSDNVCISCAPGSYKEDVGDHGCTPCPEHHTTFPNASEASDCICNFGYEPSSGTCLPCTVSYYKNFKGNNSCLSCTSNATTLLSGSLYPSDCICLPGFEGAFDTGCTPCDRDWFRATVDSACRQCPQNSGTATTASTTEAACVCKPGFHPDPATAQCVVCPVNMFKAELGSFPCSPCPQNSTSPAGSSLSQHCTCDPGFWHNHTSTPLFACAECTAGSWCPGQGAVNPCPANSLSHTGATAIEQCICASAMFMQAGACFDCPVDFYCPGDNQKHICPGHSAAPQRSTALSDCICDNGFEKDNSV